MDKKFFIIVPCEILQNRRLGPFAKILYGYIDFRQGENDFCWHKEDTIALELTTTRATIQRATKQLEAEDELIVERSHGGLNQSNHYRLAHRYNARDSRSDENGASKRSAGGASNQGTKPSSGASNRSLKTNNTKQHLKANRKNGSFCDSSVGERKIVLELTGLYTSLCPSLPEATSTGGARAYKAAKKTLISKIQNAVQEYGADLVGAAIKHFAPKATIGDGWGIILASLRQGWTKSKIREGMYDKNLIRDQQEYPKQPARGKSQPVRLPDEWKTGQEANRQVRALLAAEKNK